MKARTHHPLRRTLAAATVSLVAFTGLAACGGSDDKTTSDGLTKITMIQDWPTPWVGWIPWIVADEKGYFKDAGLDVTIQAPATVSDPVKFISTGRADVAFTTSLDVVLADEQGASVRSIGAVTQTNNWGLIFKGTAPSMDSLAGKKIAIYQDAWTKAQLGAMLKSADLTLDDVDLVTAPDDTAPLLMADKVDSATGITNAEMTEVEVGGGSPSILLAKDYGVPNVYVQVLAANDTWLDSHQTEAKSFMSAIQKATDWSVQNPDEALKIFQDVYPKALDATYAEASWKNTLPLYSSSDTDAHGYYWNDEARWQQMIDFCKSAGLTTKDLDPSALYTNDDLGAK
jgi:putative hydroxymethylpyrimidine transport system substrate-binding protein